MFALKFHYKCLPQTCLRHPDCESARLNKDAVFQRMRCALEQVIEIVTEARICGENKILPASLYDGIRDFKVGPYHISHNPCHSVIVR